MDGLNSSERSVLESFNRAQEELKAQAAEKGCTPAYNIEGMVDHPNYYKTLADFALKDSQGHYAPHRKQADKKRRR